MSDGRARSRRRPRTSRRERPLVVVSNRLPFTTEQSGGRIRFKRSPGGLVTALEPALERRGGVWIGWPGGEKEDALSVAEMKPPPNRDSKVRYHPVALTRREVSQYYGEFSNRTLWPLFHYFVARVRIDSASWSTYEAVNERFAGVAVEESTDDSIIWVHDYQLLRVPRFVRRAAPKRRVAFFLHIPFPAYEIFRILPWSRSLMRGMLSCDLVGFQIADYADHFMMCAERLLGCDVHRGAGTVRFEDRHVAVQAHPIGIDVGRFEKLARSVPEAFRRGGDPVEILGLDRLDYTKGICERFRAVERLFEKYPQYRGEVVFVQLAVPSRTNVAEYQALKRQVDEIVGRINGRFSDPCWTPIRYLVRSVSQENLVSLYQRASVALLTPLRDGMNLVAKEYVASHVDNDGVLVLSAMTGAAEELKEALVVNPYDIDAVAETLHRALSMPDDERRARMAALRNRVAAGNVQVWVRRFLKSAATASGRARARRVSRTSTVRQKLQPWLRGRPAVALFLDYDGTLTPIVDHPDKARLGPSGRRALRQAVRAPNLDVCIVSGRGLDDVKHMIHLPGLTYVGNHGFQIEGPSVDFRHEELQRFQAAVDAAAAEIAMMDLQGGWLERKGATLTIHLRSVPEACAPAIQERVESVLKSCGLRATRGKQVVEGRPAIDWNKGYAVLHVLARRYGADWSSHVRALYVGDDVTDEDAFRSLRGIGRSIRVSASISETAADFSLPDPAAVVELLRWFASGAFASEGG